MNPSANLNFDASHSHGKSFVLLPRSLSQAIPLLAPPNSDLKPRIPRALSRAGARPQTAPPSSRNLCATAGPFTAANSAHPATILVRAVHRLRVASPPIDDILRHARAGHPLTTSGQSGSKVEAPPQNPRQAARPSSASFLEEQSERFPHVACLVEFLSKQERELKKCSVREVRRCKTRKLKKWTADFCRALESNPKTAEHHEALSANACTPSHRLRGGSKST